jgi:pilus assembly protein CpaC
VAVAAGVVTVRGQVPPTTPAPQTPAAAQTATPAFPRITITAGRSTVHNTEFDITKVFLTDPETADITVVDARGLLIDGKKPGTTSLIIWGDANRVQYDLVVDPAVSVLQRQMQTVFPNEDILVSETPDAVILTGRASSNQVMLQAGLLAETLAPKAKLLNLLQLPGGQGSQQVMLQVRVAEVNRRIVQELGATLFTGPTGYRDIIARSTTQQFAAPNFSGLNRETVNGVVTDLSGEITFSDFMNLFIFNTQYNVGILLKALQQSGNFQTLAEPNLIAYNGQEAMFLSGGELPVPVVQGNTGGITVEYKEFGIKLQFRPTIAGDVIRLKVMPEVSALDFANGITIGGFRVPAITTRRAQTDVELRDGQSFAIAGLMNNTAQETKAEIPILSKIPLIGYLFKSKAETKDQTELMVLVTPHLVRALNPDQVPPLPTLPGKFLPPCDKPPCDVVPPPGGRGGRGGGSLWPFR